MLSMMLTILAAAISLVSFQLFAQAQPHLDLTPSDATHLASNWSVLVSSIATSVCAVGYAWINASSANIKRRAEEAEKKLDELEVELKALQTDRNLWMKRAYNCGYKTPGEADAP